MPIQNGAPPDLSLTYSLGSAQDIYVLPDPNKFALYAEVFELEDLSGNKAGKLYYTGSSFATEKDGYPNAFFGTLDFGVLGTLVFLFSIPPNLPLDPETGFYIPYQTFNCRILQGSGDFRFIQNGFVVIYTVPGKRLVYVYLDK